MDQTLQDIRRTNAETERTRRFYLDCGYKVRSDYGGMITLTLQEWPYVSVVIDRSKGYVVDTIYPPK
jgi:hypothetical protein